MLVLIRGKASDEDTHEIITTPESLFDAGFEMADNNIETEHIASITMWFRKHDQTSIRRREK